MASRTPGQGSDGSGSANVRCSSALGATGLVMASGFDKLLTQRWEGMAPN